MKSVSFMRRSRGDPGVQTPPPPLKNLNFFVYFCIYFIKVPKICLRASWQTQITIRALQLPPPPPPPGKISESAHIFACRK